MSCRKRRTPRVTTPSISESESTINDLSEDVLRIVFRFLEAEQRLTFWRVNWTFCRLGQSYWYSVKYVDNWEYDKNYLEKVLLCPKLKKFHFDQLYCVTPGNKKPDDVVSRGYGALLAKKCPNIEEVYITMYDEWSDWTDMRISHSKERRKNFRKGNVLKMLRGYFSVVKMNNKIVNLELAFEDYEFSLVKIINVLAKYVKLQYLRVESGPEDEYDDIPDIPNLRILAQNVTSLYIGSYYECFMPGPDLKSLKIYSDLSKADREKIVDRHLQLTTLDIFMTNMRGVFTDLQKLVNLESVRLYLGDGYSGPYHIDMTGFDKWLMRNGRKLKLLKISFDLSPVYYSPDQNLNDSYVTGVCRYCPNLEVLKVQFPGDVERSDGHVMESLRNLKQLKDLLIISNADVYTVTRNNLFLLLDDLKHLKVIGIVLNSNKKISLKFKKYLEEYLDRHVDRRISIKDL